MRLEGCPAAALQKRRSASLLQIFLHLLSRYFFISARPPLLRDGHGRAETYRIRRIANCVSLPIKTLLRIRDYSSCREAMAIRLETIQKVHRRT
jgi:hypothetical protein